MSSHDTFCSIVRLSRCDMREKFGRTVQAISTARESRPLDQSIARALSERIGEDRRRAFAHSFTEAVIRELCGARRGSGTITSMPEAVERCHLAPDAVIAAKELGRMAASLDPLNAAYFVGSLYTSALPEKYRAGHGIFYTPPRLAERLVIMAEQGGIDWRTARVLDPACGGGSFLLPVAARMMAALAGTEPAFILQQLAARLRGFDIDVFGSWLAQAMLELLTCDLAQAAGRALPALVERRDSLDLREQDFGAYDLVVGNPPYGRVSLAPERRKSFARSVYGHANQYGLFTDAALHWVRRGGVVAYVTPTSMLSGLYYKALRALLLTEAPPLSINFVNERDGVFADVLQETMLATYRRGGLPRGGTVGFITMSNGAKVSSRKAGTIGLPTRVAAPWLLPRAQDQAMLVRRLRSMPHRLADYGYGVSTGPLVWNRHKEQLCAAPTAGCYPVIWAESVTSDGRFLWRSDRRNHAPWLLARLPKDAWLIVKQPCVLLQRTTAKEQARRLIAAELPENFVRKYEGVSVENHLNMVRALGPKPDVPAAVVAALLNSAAIDAAFRCINGSVAVSAFELEELPLPAPPIMSKLVKLVANGASRRRIESTIAAAYRVADANAAS